MKIAINLGSILLGKALQEQLQKEQEFAEVVMINFAADCNLYDPDFIITDAYTIKQERPACLSRSKTILLDYGLSEDTIASIIMTNSIDGIMTPDADICLLIKAFHAINKGQIWIDNSNIKALVNFTDRKDSGTAGGLSNKEREVVINISTGLTNKEIASQLFISEQTVKTHVNSIFKKLNVTRRTQLVPLGIKLRESLIP